MVRKNRYCCLYMPISINEKCNYFELDLQTKDLKIMVTDINKELNSQFQLNKMSIDESYGMILFDNENLENQYVKFLGKKEICGNCLYITHIANFDEFFKSSNINIYNEKFLKQISHNSLICRKIIFLCINFIIYKKIN